MGRTTMTRRRALALGAAAGLGSLLARAPVSALASAPEARGFSLQLGPGDFEGRRSRVLRAPRRFQLAGLRGSEVRDGAFQLRVRRAGGSWSQWFSVPVHDSHAPDGGRTEHVSEPVWLGAADELQVQAGRSVRGAVHVHLVAVPAPSPRARAAASTRARVAQTPVPGTPPPIIPRSVWGPGFQPREEPEFGRVDVALVHHTADGRAYRPEESASIVLGIAKYHRDTNKWNDIGYNFLIDQYGQVFEGRAGGVEMAVLGAHASGYNGVSTGIAFIGHHGQTGISEAAMAAAAQLIGWKMSLHGVPVLGIVEARPGKVLQRVSSHRDVNQTECPGNALYAQLGQLRERAAALAVPLAAFGFVTIEAADTSVLWGDDAVFTGTFVRPGGAPGAGAVVALQKVGPSGRWSTISRVPVLEDGRWVARVPWKRGAAVRAVAEGQVSQALDVAMVPRASARTATSRVRAGDSVQISGRMRPNSPIDIAISRAGGDERFRFARKVRVRSRNGRWSASIRLARPGLYRFTPRVDGVQIGEPIFVRAVRTSSGGIAAGS